MDPSRGGGSVPAARDGNAGKCLTKLDAALRVVATLEPLRPQNDQHAGGIAPVASRLRLLSGRHVPHPGHALFLVANQM